MYRITLTTHEIAAIGQIVWTRCRTRNARPCQETLGSFPSTAIHTPSMLLLQGMPSKEVSMLASLTVPSSSKSTPSAFNI